MSPIRLTDEQLTAIMAAAQPLPVGDRGPFLEAVAAGLQGRVIGDGTVYLAICEAQRRRRAANRDRGRAAGAVAPF
jgi:hypothetical protein